MPTNPMRILLVDDEAPARSRLRHLLKDDPQAMVVGECASGQQAVEFIRQTPPDLVFLDIRMPGMDGFGVCAAVGPERMPWVVFVTAYDRFALQAFEVHAIDYLLKPVDRERLQRTLRVARDRLRAPADPSPDPERLLALLAKLRPATKTLERLAVKVDGRVVFLRTAEIEWLEADGNYVKVHAAGAAHLVRDTLSALEADLPTDRFLRVSRSAIVNLDAVKELQPLFYGDYAVLLRNGASLTLSRTYRDRVEKWLARGRG